MEIVIDVDALLRCSDSLSNVNYELQTNMNNIENLVLGLGSEWQGQTAKAYENNILIVKKQFEYLNKYIEEYTQVLKTIAAEYAETEKNITMRLEG